MSPKEIEQMINHSLENLNLLIDSSKVLGTPLQIDNNRIVIPISKITYGFGVLGGEFITKEGQVIQNNLLDDYSSPFQGGTIGGVNVIPYSFLLIDNNNYQIIKIDQKDTLFDKLLDLLIVSVKKYHKKNKE